MIDTLNPAASQAPHLLPAFFSAVFRVPRAAVSLVAVYHADVPALPPPSSSSSEYAPHPLALISSLATAVLRVSSLAHAAAARRAERRSVQAPEFGLSEGREGVLVGLREPVGAGAGAGERDLVVEMEVRRRSGRAVAERFVLAERRRGDAAGQSELGVVLFDLHPAFTKPEDENQGQGHETAPLTTFDVGLTEKQRRDREGVVLPYFDAQVEVGGGEGGRILYEMGREDDFDEEEDEI